MPTSPTGEQPDALEALAEMMEAPEEPVAEPSSTDGSAPSGVDLQGALGQIQEFFDGFVPPEKLVIRGAYGGEHHVPMSQPGRVEVVVMRTLRSLAEKGVSLPSMKNGVGDLVSGVLEAASSDEFVSGVETCFRAAYPRLIKAERALALEQGFDDPGVEPLDLFSITEAAKVFTPLLAGLMVTGQGLFEMVPK